MMDSQEKNLVIGTAASPVEEQEVKEEIIQAAEAPEVVTTEAVEPEAQPEEALKQKSSHVRSTRPRRRYSTASRISLMVMRYRRKMRSTI